MLFSYLARRYVNNAKDKACGTGQFVLVQKNCPMLVALKTIPHLHVASYFRIVFQMERSIDDIAGFINDMVGSWVTGQTRWISL
jgi:hypothetical protein